MDNDAFTISVASLDKEGPIWFAEKGVYVTNAKDKTRYSDYRKRINSRRTISQRVRVKPEQSFAGAGFGQPRPHAVNYNLGCKQARQRFWLEPNGDLFLRRENVTQVEGKDTERFVNRGSARFFFGLEKWCVISRFAAPVLGYSNSAQFKTSDEANAVMWLRYMYVFTLGKLLHLGRAIPRAWLTNGNRIEARSVSTCFGEAGVAFHSRLNSGRIIATVQLSLSLRPDRILVRFRHPEERAIRAARVNGQTHELYEPLRGDVDISGYDGKIVVEVYY